MAAWTTIPDSDLDPESPITTSLMQALRDNPVAITEGASGAPKVVPAGTSGIPYPIHSNVVEVGNVGAGEDDLMSYTVPANTLANDGDRLKVFGTFHGNAADTGTVKFLFGVGSSFFLNTVILSTAKADLKVYLDIIRTGGATQIIAGYSVRNFAVELDLGVAATETLSGTIVLKFTGENDTDASDDAIVQDSMFIEYIPAP